MRVGTCLLVAALCVATAVSRPFAGIDVPSQVHINQGNVRGGAMTITWITEQETDGMVFYGTDRNNLNMKANQDADAERYTYQSAYAPQYTSGLIHHTTITHLSHSTTYYYKCGVDGAMSQVYSFKTPPSVGPNQHVVLGLIGDLGQTVNSSTTLDHIAADKSIQMTVLVGDLSYADSQDQTSPTRNCTQKRWDSWGQLVEPVFANLPLMVLPGNHEMEQGDKKPATTEPFVAFQHRFKMPSEASGAKDGNLYYSFEIGPAHVIMLNSYMDFDENSNQYKWLLYDLSMIDRQTTPWVIACMHAPWYNSNTAHHDEPEEYKMRETMEPVFHQHNVDLVFSGHVHAYERMHPVYNQKVQSGATTYINIGDGGNREGPASHYYSQPDWSAYRMAAFGHGRLELFNSTHALWHWNRNDQSPSGIADQVWLVHSSQGGLEAHPYRGLLQSTI